MVGELYVTFEKLLIFSHKLEELNLASNKKSQDLIILWPVFGSESEGGGFGVYKSSVVAVQTSNYKQSQATTSKKQYQHEQQQSRTPSTRPDVENNQN